MAAEVMGRFTEGFLRQLRSKERYLGLKRTYRKVMLKIPGGTLEVGGPADIAIADPAKVWTVEPEKLHSRSKNTVFKGMTFTGKVVRTICRGETVFAEE